jgi:predicted NBD/HSP70 family sugar kinase
VPAGQRYADAILHAIDACDVFLVVYSANADRSPHVPNEIEKAASADKAMLLVRTDATDPHNNSRISLFLASYQWFEASSGPLASHMPRMATSVQQLLDQREPIGVPAGDTPRKADYTKDVAPRSSREGHPEVSSRRMIGIEVGATTLRGCVVDLDGLNYGLPAELEHSEPVSAGANARTLLEQTKAMVGTLIARHFPGDPPAGIGVAVPGQVDLRAGALKFGPNLFGARNVPFRTYLSRSFPGIAIRVDNEVRCATRCELHLGIGQEFDSFVCIFIGAGVGSGAVIDGRIHFGHNYCAGEIGHIKIASTGPPCVCGQIGCLETFIKAQAIVERATAKAIEWENRELPTLLSSAAGNLDPIAVVKAIEQGDDAAQEVAAEVAESVGLGIANYLNLVNPSAVVMGGGLMTGFFLPMIEEITNSVQRNALPEVANTPIVQSAHSSDAGVIGAALLFHPADEWAF